MLAIIAVAVALVVAPYATAAISNAFAGTALTVSSGAIAGGTAGLGASIAGAATAGAAGSLVSQTVGVATGIQDKFSWKAVALAAIGGGVGAGFGGAFSNSITNPALQAMARGAAASAVTQGIGVVTGLQDKFSWAAVAAAGVGAGVGQLVGSTKLAGAIGATSPLARDIFVSMADAVGNAATRTLINGSDFGDNVIASLPDVIGGAIGRRIGGGVLGALSEAARVRGEAAEMKVAPLTIKPINRKIEVDYSTAGLDPVTVMMPPEQTEKNANLSGQMRYIESANEGQGRFTRVGLPNMEDGEFSPRPSGVLQEAGAWGQPQRASYTIQNPAEARASYILLEPEQTLAGAIATQPHQDVYVGDGLTIFPYSGSRKGPNFPEARKVLEAETMSSIAFGGGNATATVTQGQQPNKKQRLRPGTLPQQAPPPSRRPAQPSSVKTGRTLVAPQLSPEVAVVKIYRLDDQGQVGFLSRPIAVRNIYPRSGGLFVPLTAGQYRVVVSPYQALSRPVNAHIVPSFVQ